MVPGAGHSMYDPSIAHELLEATDRMRQLPLPPPPSQDPRSSGKGRDKQLDVAPV